MHTNFLASLALVLTFAFTCNCGTTSDAKIFLANNRGIDYKFQGKKDEHRFGVELEENKQFHHTITDADGVRLGCYGYELFGEKYSTNYIADGKGYRLAPKNSDVITVYAKDTLEPRKASFIGSFGESEVKTGHIRYLFPEGCEAPKVAFDSLTREETRKKFIESLQNEALQNQRDNSLQRGSKKIENDKKSSFDNLNSENLRTPAPRPSLSTKAIIRNTTPSAVITTSEVPAAVITTSEAPALIAKIETQQGSADEALPIEPIMSLTPPELDNGNSGFNMVGKLDVKALEEMVKDDSPEIFLNDQAKNEEGQCCESDRLKLIMPGNDNSCGSRMAQISIPILAEKLSSVPMKELMNLSSARSTLAMVQNLQKIIEKYDL